MNSKASPERITGLLRPALVDLIKPPTRTSISPANNMSVAWSKLNFTRFIYFVSLDFSAWSEITCKLI